MKVMLREALVSPSQIGRKSFPSKSADGFRPYVKGRVGLHDSGEARTWQKEYDDPDEDMLDDAEPEGIRIVDGPRDSLDMDEDEERDDDETGEDK